jgi:hypothetical protein
VQQALVLDVVGEGVEVLLVECGEEKDGRMELDGVLPYLLIAVGGRLLERVCFVCRPLCSFRVGSVGVGCRPGGVGCPGRAAKFDDSSEILKLCQ